MPVQNDLHFALRMRAHHGVEPGPASPDDELPDAARGVALTIR